MTLNHEVVGSSPTVPIMKLKREASGLYVTEDGRYEVSIGTIFGFCDNPHPMRNGDYCDGGEEHAQDSWGVWDREKDDYVDSNAIHFDTKRQAVEYLEEYLGNSN